jgi:hypothetical protein
MIHNEDSGWTEAEVTINGRTLTFAESMTLRVAVSSMRLWLAHAETRQHLGAVAPNYDHHLALIERYIVNPEARAAAPPRRKNRSE